MQLLLTTLANAIIGFIVGACGVSGFLLPMFYTALTDFFVPEALVLSYWVFVISSPLGFVGCKDKMAREKKTLGWLCVGSAIGAVLGVKLNSFFSPKGVKIILYIVVLLAGIYIVINESRKKASDEKRSPKLDSKPFMLAFGIITGAVCALGGSGGPILVMPLLATMGMEVHTAMAVGLLDSLFVSVPAFVGYVRNVNLSDLTLYMVVVLLAYCISMFIGRKLSSKVPSKPLKMVVGVFSVIIAVYMIITTI